MSVLTNGIREEFSCRSKSRYELILLSLPSEQFCKLIASTELGDTSLPVPLSAVALKHFHQLRTIILTANEGKSLFDHLATTSDHQRLLEQT
ncbi:MAG: hypothetical protein ACPHL6_13285, partial [Rubripirellula sp.]